MDASVWMSMLIILNQQLISAVVEPEGEVTSTNLGDKVDTSLPRGKRLRPRNEASNQTSASEPVVNHSDSGPMLQRISDRLTALQALDEQQLRRLETLEYKLTRLEVQQQERMEGLRSELREVSRRVQQVDWSVGKMEANVESVKVDTTGLRQGQEMQGQRGYSVARGEPESGGKLQAVAASLLAVRGALATLRGDVVAVKGNISALNNATGQMSARHSQCLTKQHFTASIVDLKHGSAPRSTQPCCATQHDPARHDPARQDPLPADCRAVQAGGANRSGVYRIRPRGAERPFYVSCRLEAGGGGWTVVQQRNEGAVDFYRSWVDYKNGFGNIGAEFWLGLEKIYLLTATQVNELLVELEDFDGARVSARYRAFAVGSEAEGYPISLLGDYEGDAGDSLSYHAGQKFSTLDLDNDAWADGSCAETHTGGWWYNSCDNSNLNGRYLGAGELPPEYEYQGMYWNDWHGPGYSLRSARLSVRPHQEKLADKKGPSTEARREKLADEQRASADARHSKEAGESNEGTTVNARRDSARENVIEH